MAQRVNTAMNQFGESLAERDAFHSAAIDGLTNAMAERDQWNQQMADAVAQLTHAVANNAAHMAQSEATAAMTQDAMHSAGIESLAGALAEQSAWNQQMTEVISQLTHAMTETAAHMAQANATTAVTQDAMHEITMHSVVAALAEQSAWNQQMTETVAQLTHAIAENAGHLAHTAATATTGQDQFHAAAMESFANAMAEQSAWNQQMTETVAQLTHALAESSGGAVHAAETNAMSLEAMQATATDHLGAAMEQQNAMNQQVLDVVSQVAQGLGEASSHTAETLSALLGQLQQRIDQLESQVADLQNRSNE